MRPCDVIPQPVQLAFNAACDPGGGEISQGAADRDALINHCPKLPSPRPEFNTMGYDGWLGPDQR